MRVEWNKTAAYRDATAARTPSPAATFLCAICKKGKAILGRRKISQDGNRIEYSCKECQVK